MDIIEDAVIEDYDVLIEGTNLVHAILAAALSQAGLKVMHIDQNDYYGDEDACIHVPSFRPPPHVTEFNLSKGPLFETLGAPRDYNIEVSPKLLYAASEMITVLRNAGLSEYMQFKALNSFNLWKDDKLVRVPSSKEDVFTDPTMPLIKKRRLMKFIKYTLEAAKHLKTEDQTQSLRQVLQDTFRLDDDITDAIVYSLAQSGNGQVSLQIALPIIRLHLKSLGTFGPFPVVIPMYGATSELSQAFCRKAAVKGCTYILGQRIERSWKEDAIIQLESGHHFRARTIISRKVCDNLAQLRRRTLVVQGDFSELMNGGDGACITFSTPERPIIQAQIYGAGAGSCPNGQSIIYLSGEAASIADMDHTQTILQEQYQFGLIAHMDFVVRDLASLDSLDDMVKHAREQFMHVAMQESGDFLPREMADDSETAIDNI